MSLSFKNVIGAGLLTLAVVGGTATLLDSTLKPAPVQYAQTGTTHTQTANLTDQPVRHAEVTVIEGPAS